MKNNKTLLQFNYEQTVVTEKYFFTFGKAFLSINTSTKFGMTLGVLQIKNIIVIPMDAFVILASLFRTRDSPP